LKAIEEEVAEMQHKSKATDSPSTKPEPAKIPRASKTKVVKKANPKSAGVTKKKENPARLTKKKDKQVEKTNRNPAGVNKKKGEVRGKGASAKRPTTLELMSALMPQEVRDTVYAHMWAEKLPKDVKLSFLSKDHFHSGRPHPLRSIGSVAFPLAGLTDPALRKEAIQYAYENIDAGKDWFGSTYLPGLKSCDITDYLHSDMFDVGLSPKDFAVSSMTCVIKLNAGQHLRQNLYSDFEELANCTLKKGFKLTITLQQTGTDTIHVQKLQNACTQLIPVVSRFEQKGVKVELNWEFKAFW
jgi:hypothetical protein